MASSRLISFQVAIKAVPAIKVFADISADVVLNHESPTWMLADKIPNIEHVLIENGQLLTLQLDAFVKLPFCDVLEVGHRLKAHLMFVLHTIDHFSGYQNNQEKRVGTRDQDPADLIFGVVYKIVLDSK